MTIPNPVTEAVARAMREAYGAHTGKGVCAWSQAKAGPRKAWLACSNAAILAHLLAIRVPSEGQLRVINEAHDGEPYEEVYTAMIDQLIASAREN